MGWIDDLNNRADVGSVYKFQPPVRPQIPVQQPKKGGRGGTLTSLISEGGALGGGALGASIGSGILPGVGTLLGGALGAGIGAFTGRVAENKVRDNRLGIGDAAKEGALSAVFGASPVKLAKAALVTKGGGVGLAEALKAGAPKLEATVASKAATAGRTTVPGKLDEMANKLLTTQYGTIGKPIARATNPEKTFSQLSALGITRPNDVERISSAVTGTNGLLNKAVVKAAGDSKRVNVGDLRGVLTDAMENNGVVGTKQKELTTMFDAQMKKLLGGPKGSLDATAHPSDVLDVMKSFEKRIAQKTGKGSNYRLATDETTNQANALKLVKDELQGRLESGANVKDVLTPDLRNKLVSLHPNSDPWQKYVDNNIMKSKDLKSLRSAQAPFVNAKKIIDEADLNSMTFGGRVGNNANASIREALMNAATKVIKGPAARVAASGLKTASKVANDLPTVRGLPSTQALSSGLKIGAKSQIGEGLATGLLRNQSSPKSISDSGLTTPSSSMTLMPFNDSLNANTNALSTQNPYQAATSPTMNQNMPGLYPNSQNMSSTSPFDVSNVEANLQKLIQGGASDKDIQNYLGIVSTISDLQAKSQTAAPKLNSTQVQQANNAQSGLASLAEIAQTLQTNPNAAKLSSLPGGSLTQSLTGTGQYAAAINNATDVIGRLRSGGAINADEEKRFKALLPASFDSPDTVNYKLNTLAQLFQSFANPQGASTDTGNLASALGA